MAYTCGTVDGSLSRPRLWKFGTPKREIHRLPKRHFSEGRFVKLGGGYVEKNILIQFSVSARIQMFRMFPKRIWEWDTYTVPPGKDRWLATPISLGLSWPLTIRHRTWEWRQLSTFTTGYISYILNEVTGDRGGRIKACFTKTKLLISYHCPSKFLNPDL